MLLLAAAALGLLYGVVRVLMGSGSWRQKFLKIGGAAAVLLALFYLAFPLALVKYRLTIEVETPEGVKTGTSVGRLHYAVIPQLLGARDCSASDVVRAEAVAVDLGERGTMYALLVGRDATSGAPAPGIDMSAIFVKTLAPHLWAGKSCSRSKIYELMFLSAKAEVPAQYIPFLVRFRDEKDPKTVEAVDPDNLTASFGDGVRLKRVTIETTRDSVTTGIEKRLVWLDTLKTGSITGITVWDPARPAPTNYLPAVAFRRGVRK